MLSRGRLRCFRGMWFVGWVENTKAQQEQSSRLEALNQARTTTDDVSWPAQWRIHQENADFSMRHAGSTLKYEDFNGF